MSICYIIAAFNPDLSDIKKEDGDLIIAADKGYLYLDNVGINPDIIIGDFDSLGFVPENTDAEIIKLNKRKDDTDTLFCIKEGIKRGYKKFAVFGAVGGRTDMTVASLQTALFLCENGCCGVFCGDGYTATVIKNGTIKFKDNTKGIISVFAFGGKAYGVYEKGLSYTLDGAELSPGMPIGVSNEFTDEKAEISVKSGSLLIVTNNSFKCIEGFCND